MTYHIALQVKQSLEAANIRASKALNDLIKDHRLSNGLVADYMKASAAYKAAKKAYDDSHAALRAFHGEFVKTYKKEIAATRKAYRAQRGF